ncbi:tail assembly structural protein [Erythrobacter phage vB_EliS_R6L]|nr:tail assembly structural protein [Erythrobacter phage vB_EliS_R6L]
MTKIFEYDALWQYQATDAEVPADPAALVVPEADWLGPEPAPFGTIGGADLVDYPPATVWPLGTGIWMRRAITLDIASDLLLTGVAENQCFVYFDGVFVGAYNPTGVQLGDFATWSISIPASVATAGTHELALLCQDELPAAGSIYFYAEAEILPPVFPLWPSAPMTEALEWLTDVIVAEDSTEDRGMMRVTPRQSLDMRFYVPTIYQPLLKNLLWANRAKQWLVPFWPHVQHVGAVAAGDTTLTVSTDFVDFREQGLALIWQSPDAFQIVGIAEIADSDTLIINQPTRSFADAHVLPLRRGFTPGDPTRRFDGRKSSVQASFLIEENEQFAVSAPAQYEGRDIYFEAGVLEGDGLDEQMTVALDVFDEALGGVSYSTAWPTPRPRRPHRVVRDGLEEAWALRRWLHRRAGRFRDFWQPTFEADLIVRSTGALTTALIVRADDYLRYANNRTHIAVETAAGWLPRKIMSAAQIGLDTVQLVLDTSLAIDAAAIKRVSWLGLWRQDADRVEINWLGGQVCAATLPILEISP